jgi:hypothetical protein
MAKAKQQDHDRESLADVDWRTTQLVGLFFCAEYKSGPRLQSPSIRPEPMREGFGLTPLANDNPNPVYGGWLASR